MRRPTRKPSLRLESGPVPEFSGFRLHQRKPRLYAAICRMLAENMATAAIARACGVSPSTVTAVSLREQPVVELEREKLLRSRALGRKIIDREANRADPDDHIIS